MLGRERTSEESADHEFVGGASLPSALGVEHLSWPMVRLEFSESGLAITRRSFFGRRRSDQRTVAWFCAWSELSKAVVGRRSIYFVPVSARGCVFGTPSKRRLGRVVSVLVDRAVEIERARHNVGRYLRI